MSRTTLASQAAAHAACVAALEARISIGTELCRSFKRSIVELESKLATRGHIATAPVVPAVITTYVDHAGWICRKTRIGTRSVIARTNERAYA